MDNPIASNIFGILGTIIWSVELFPQIRLNHIRRSTEGVSLFCFTCWYTSGIILAPYLVVRKLSPALVVQTSAISSLNMCILFQHFYFDRKIATYKLKIAAVSVAIFTLGFTIGLYYMMYYLDEHETVVNLVVSILSAFFMLMGFLPQIYEIYSSKNNPEAISKIFVVMDFSGGSCAIISLAFIVPFDWLSFATYVIVPICEAIQFSLIIYYNRLVKTGGVQYQDEIDGTQDRKLSVWKRTHRTKTTTPGNELSKRDTTKTTKNIEP